LVAIGEEMRSKTQNRQSMLGVQRREHLERLLEKSGADLAAKTASMDGAELMRQRAVELCAQGLLTRQECESTQTRAVIETKQVESAKNEVSIAQFLLESSRHGLDVGQDVGSEVTYARQQRDDLTLRLATLRQQLEAREGQVKALQLRVAPPPMTIKVTSRTRIWSVLRQSVTQVAKGEPLFEVVDCDQLFVFATMSQDRYRKLRVGMKANVTIAGRTFNGKIAQLLGPYGTFSQEHMMRPQPPVILSGQDAESAAVAVELPELSAVLGPSCEVGTLGEVKFIP